MAEFFGTMVLLAFGDGVVAAAVAGLPGSGRTSGPTTIFVGVGGWLLITFGWAFAVTLAVYVAGGITGAHLNPAVTLGLAVRRKFPWNKVLPYSVVQVLGAFFGGLIVYMVYGPAIQAFDLAAKAVPQQGTALATYSIFATFPAAYFHGSSLGPLVDQIVGTAFLLILILAITDGRNLAPVGNVGPFIVGLAIAAIGMSYGPNAGYAINPARDFGPRMVAWLFGWGKTAFPGTFSSGAFHFSSYFWIPIIGPLVGAVVGVLLYDFFIGDVLASRLKKNEEPGSGRVAPSE
ncbi:MAG: aquaporin family protein [Candidatus Dormibacteraeota bacterium]|nr:aquaporin family protein [Candidatus Dormibacteraeota bacterium]